MAPIRFIADCCPKASQRKWRLLHDPNVFNRLAARSQLTIAASHEGPPGARSVSRRAVRGHVRLQQRQRAPRRADRLRLAGDCDHGADRRADLPPCRARDRHARHLGALFRRSAGPACARRRAAFHRRPLWQFPRVPGDRRQSGGAGDSAQPGRDARARGPGSQGAADSAADPGYRAARIGAHAYAQRGGVGHRRPRNAVRLAEIRAALCRRVRVRAARGGWSMA